MINNSWHIILNPTAGNGKALRKKDKINKAFQKAGISFEIIETKHIGHAETIVADAVKDGIQNFLSVGGDGTNNEVVNGIMNQASQDSIDLHFASLPFGTGNDWARGHKLFNNPEKLIALISNGKSRLQDVGVAKFWENGQEKQRYFINVAGMAFDAFVVHSLAARRSKYLSKFVYMSEILKSLKKYPGADLNIQIGLEPYYEGKVYTVNAGICKFSGGGMQITPHAVSDDGLLALTVIDYIPKWKIILSFYKLLIGTILSHPAAHHIKTKEIKIKATKGNFGIELDGEYAGEGPVTLSIIPDALKFIAP